MSKKDKFSPESLMMSYGYDPHLSEGAIKSPIFQTSTFVFKSAEEGKAYFEIAYGLREKDPDENYGLIYSRLNNPDLEILEDRLCLWDKAEGAAVFESGMAAISTVLMEFLQPGDLLVYSKPVYGGTDYFINQILPKYGIEVLGFNAGVSNQEIIDKIRETGLGEKLKMIYIETPGNPTNSLIDIAEAKNICNEFGSLENEPLLVVDNTYLGPVFQHPLQHGADLVIYSATKFIGGHSDVIAGAVLGSDKLVKRVKVMRTFMGSMAGPWTGWLLMRSLETLKLRMEEQARNAQKVAAFLRGHPNVKKVYYLEYLAEENKHIKEIYEKQCLSSGSMISFDIFGGQGAAFNFLNSLELFHLAVSLGSTESLAEHPATMTHSDISPEEQEKMGITQDMIRLSIGVENADDLIADIKQALED